MNSYLIKSLPALASECFGLWRLSGSYKSGGVYFCSSLKEWYPFFLDEDYVRKLMLLIRWNKRDLLRCIACGLEVTFYSTGIRDQLYDEMRIISTCRKMVVDDRNGLTPVMAILILFALSYEYPVVFLSGRTGGDGNEQL